MINRQRQVLPESVSEEVCDRLIRLSDCETNDVNEIAKAAEYWPPLDMDTDLAEHDYEMISAGRAYQEEELMEEGSQRSFCTRCSIAASR